MSATAVAKRTAETTPQPPLDPPAPEPPAPEI
jgi:hypothetical protein